MVAFLNGQICGVQDFLLNISDFVFRGDAQKGKFVYLKNSTTSVFALSTSIGHLWTQNQRCSTENLQHLWLEFFVEHLCCVHKCKGRMCSTKSLKHLLHFFVEHIWCVHPPKDDIWASSLAKISSLSLQKGLEWVWPGPHPATTQACHLPGPRPGPASSRRETLWPSISIFTKPFSLAPPSRCHNHNLSSWQFEFMTRYSEGFLWGFLEQT